MAMTRSSRLGTEVGRVKVSSVVFLLILAAAVYSGLEVGGVFFRKMKLEEAIRQQVSFAGQIEDNTIRQEIQNEVRRMDLPPEALRVGLTRTARPRTMHVTIQYAESVNLFVVEPQIPVRIQISRGF